MERVILGIILLVGSAAGQTAAHPQIVFDPIPPTSAPSAGDCLKVGYTGVLSIIKCGCDVPETSAVAQSISAQTPNRNLHLDKDGNVATPQGLVTDPIPLGSSGKCMGMDSSGASLEPVDCPGTGTISLYQGSTSMVTVHPAPGAPSNEVVMQALEYGKTYHGAAVDVLIIPQLRPKGRLPASGEEAGRILLAITAKVNADFAIIEVLHREVARIGGRDMKVFRSKTQAVRVSAGAVWLSDPIPLKLEDVEKINVRLVTESNVVEFWSDTSEVKAIKAR